MIKKEASASLHHKIKWVLKISTLFWEMFFAPAKGMAKYWLLGPACKPRCMEIYSDSSPLLKGQCQFKEFTQVFLVVESAICKNLWQSGSCFANWSKYVHIYVYIHIKLIDIHNILLKDQNVTPKMPPPNLDIADRQSIGYTWAQTNSMRFSRFPSVWKKFNWANLSRFRVFFVVEVGVSFRLAQSQGAVLVSQPLQLNCTWQSCVRHQPYPPWPNPCNSQWWFSKQEEDIVSTSKTFPPLKASIYYFRTCPISEHDFSRILGCWQGWIKFIQIVQLETNHETIHGSPIVNFEIWPIFNPFEKYARQRGNLPQVSGWKFQKYLSCHQPDIHGIHTFD